MFLFTSYFIFINFFIVEKYFSFGCENQIKYKFALLDIYFKRKHGREMTSGTEGHYFSWIFWYLISLKGKIYKNWWWRMVLKAFVVFNKIFPEKIYKNTESQVFKQFILKLDNHQLSNSHHKFLNNKNTFATSIEILLSILNIFGQLISKTWIKFNICIFISAKYIKIFVKMSEASANKKSAIKNPLLQSKMMCFFYQFQSLSVVR